jgi:uncharacterized protein YjbI with pentapeptide repeats
MALPIIVKEDFLHLLDNHKTWYNLMQKGVKREMNLQLRLLEVSIQNLNITSHILADGVLARCRIQHCEFYQCNLAHVMFIDTVFENCSFVECNLNQADFRSAKCIGTNFMKSELIEADFKDADLEHADFSYTNLSFARFSNTDLRYVNWHLSNLQDARFRNSKLYNIKKYEFNSTANVIFQDALLDFSGHELKTSGSDVIKYLSKD